MSPERLERMESCRKTLVNVSNVFRSIGIYLRSRPILSPTFAPIGFHLGSLVSTDSGLDKVTYFVVHPETRFAISMGDTKAAALSMARLVIGDVGAARITGWAVQYAAEYQKAWEEKRRAYDEEVDAKRVDTPAVRSISRRRRQIFEKAGGACHYCKTVLTLDGKWHIEHMLPKALGGDNHPDNLTAACVPCNHKKNDRTDVEFIELLAKERTATT